jgi:hypothetical protein
MHNLSHKMFGLLRRMAGFVESFGGSDYAYPAEVGYDLGYDLLYRL